MGTATYRAGYDQGITSPYAHLRQYVFSSTLPADVAADVEVVNRDALAFVRKLKSEAGQGIWLCGGGKLAAALFPEIDEIVVKRYPVLFGSGIPMIDGAYDPTRFTLEEQRVFGSGAAIQTYRRA